MAGINLFAGKAAKADVTDCTMAEHNPKQQSREMPEEEFAGSHNRNSKSDQA